MWELFYGLLLTCLASPNVHLNSFSKIKLPTSQNTDLFRIVVCSSGELSLIAMSVAILVLLPFDFATVLKARAILCSQGMLATFPLWLGKSKHLYIGTCTRYFLLVPFLHTLPHTHTYTYIESILLTNN